MHGGHLIEVLAAENGTNVFKDTYYCGYLSSIPSEKNKPFRQSARDRTDQNKFEAEKDIRQNTTDESVLGCYFNGYFYWIQFQATFYGKNICNEYFR